LKRHLLPELMRPSSPHLDLITHVLQCPAIDTVLCGLNSTA
jgi:hypothetical protein